MAHVAIDVDALRAVAGKLSEIAADLDHNAQAGSALASAGASFAGGSLQGASADAQARFTKQLANLAASVRNIGGALAASATSYQELEMAADEAFSLGGK